jgi:serine/threonine protein kinase
MAPEVKNLKNGKSYDPKQADVYSLGVSLFVMLFKSFPIHKEDAEFGDASNTYESSEDVSVSNPFAIPNEKWT